MSSTTPCWSTDGGSSRAAATLKESADAGDGDWIDVALVARDLAGDRL